MGQERDKRAANWFWMNKSIVDEHGAKIGAIGIAVYAILARCANDEGHAFPSVRYIARHLGLATNTVIKHLRALEKHGLITMTLRRDVAGDKDTTEYTLLTPPTLETQEGVSISETPKSQTASSSVNNRTSRNEVSQKMRHGVSSNNTPDHAEVSQKMRHGVSSGETPTTGGVSQMTQGGVSTVETFKDQENKNPADLTPPPIPPMGDRVDGEVVYDACAASYDESLHGKACKVRDHLNLVTGRQNDNLVFIKAILGEGATVADCTLVIDWWKAVKIVEQPSQAINFNAATPFKRAYFYDYRAFALEWEAKERPNPTQDIRRNGRYAGTEQYLGADDLEKALEERKNHGHA